MSITRNTTKSGPAGSLFMQQVLGYGAVQIGLAFLPVALAIGILSLGFSERLNTRFGARRVLVPGLALITVGLALITRVLVQADYVRDFLPAMPSGPWGPR